MRPNKRAFPLRSLRPLAILLTCALSACSPKLSGTVDGIAGRLVTVVNEGDTSLTIQRIIANDSPENSSCNDYPNKVLGPHESYSTTFVICGPVRVFRVETDQGSSDMLRAGGSS